MRNRHNSTTQCPIRITDEPASSVGQQIGNVLRTVGCDSESERVGHLPHDDLPTQEVKGQS